MGMGRSVASSGAALVALAAACGGPERRPSAAPATTAHAASSSPTPTASGPRALGPRPTSATTFVLPQSDASSNCRVDELIRTLGPTCRRVVPTRVRGPNNARADAASDGDACTIWNATAFPPVSVWLELPSGAAVDALVWVPEMTPTTALVDHALTLVPAGAPPIELSAKAVMTTATPYVFVFPARTAMSAIEIRTRSSPSHVAWRDVVVVDCDADLALPDRAAPAPTAVPLPPPPPPPKVDHVDGKGWCSKDADCVPQSCCRSGETCVATHLAPHCEMMACPANIGAYESGASRCVCQAHRCGADHTR